MNLAKHEFGQACTAYLGVWSGEDPILQCQDRSIVSFPAPTNRNQLMRFLGMVGYYRKFCENVAVVAEPLTQLLQKKQTYNWKEDQQAAFNEIKRLLASAPVLAMTDFEEPFIIHVDASDSGLGAVLMQESGENLEHPIGYFSQKFNNSQRTYCTGEKRLLYTYYPYSILSFMLCQPSF